MKGGIVKERVDRLERERSDRLARKAASDEIDQQCRSQRPMYDQQGIAFLFLSGGPVVVNTMSVEGIGGVAKQEDRVRHDLPLPCELYGRRWTVRRAIRSR